MKRISTHILDTSRGRPAAGVPIRLLSKGEELNVGVSDADGRCANLIPDGHVLKAGLYCLVFDITALFPEGLYPEVTITFRATEGATHYHIPLLISPFGYTTYRGS